MAQVFKKLGIVMVFAISQQGSQTGSLFAKNRCPDKAVWIQWPYSARWSGRCKANGLISQQEEAWSLKWWTGKAEWHQRDSCHCGLVAETGKLELAKDDPWSRDRRALESTKSEGRQGHSEDCYADKEHALRHCSIEHVETPHVFATHSGGAWGGILQAQHRRPELIWQSVHIVRRFLV